MKRVLAFAGLLVVALALALGACSESTRGNYSWVIVHVRSTTALTGIRQFGVHVTHAGGTRDLTVPPQARDISLPSSFALRFDKDRSGEVTVLVRAFSGDRSELASAQAVGTITAGGEESLDVIFGGGDGDGGVVDAAIPDAAGPDVAPGCGNHIIEAPEVCDNGIDNNDVVGPCSLRCRPVIVWTRTTQYANRLATGPGGFLSLAFNENNSTLAVARLDDQGGEQWRRSYASAMQSEGSATAIDTMGNVVVVGYENAGIQIGTTAVTRRYDSAGTFLWMQKYNNTNNVDGGALQPAARATRATTDSTGAVIITGSESPYSSNSVDIMVRKYSAGGTLAWTRNLGAVGMADTPGDVAVDHNDNVVVVGTIANPTDILLVKYDSSGTQAWTERVDSSGSDAGRDVVVNSRNEIIIFGSYGGQPWVRAYSPTKAILWTRNLVSGDNYTSMAIDSQDNLVLVGARGRDIVTKKLASNGNDVWERVHNGATNGDDYPFDMVIDGNDDIVVLGREDGLTGAWLRKYGP